MSHIEAQRMGITIRIPWYSRFLSVCLIGLVLLTLVQPARAQAAYQEIGGLESEGNLRIRVDDLGLMGVERYVTGLGWINQIFASSPGSKGSKLYVNGASINLGYFDGTQATSVENSVSGNTITTRWNSGEIEIIQKTTYTNGNAYYRLEWSITNHGSSPASDLRFFHGEDTYLLGGDKGAGFWDAANHAIGVKKPDASGIEQRMTLQGVTVPYAYDSQIYWAITQNGAMNALSNTIDADVGTDNGYGLEWRTPSLDPGASWTIIAFEKFNDAAATGLSVTAPVSIDCEAGTTCEMNYSVQNVGADPANVILSLTGGPAWGETIVSPGSSFALPAGVSQPVVVRVSVPASTAGGTTANITLNASDGTNTSSDTGGIYVPAPPMSAPTAFTNASPADADTGVPYSHTFTANGDPSPSYSLVSGTLPAGLSLDSSTGLLSGTPVTPGIYTFTLTAANPAGSFTQTFTLQVARAASAITLTSSPSSPVYSQPVHFDALVTAVIPAAGSPTGQVQFSLDGADFGTPVTLAGDGTASLDLANLPAGGHQVSARYLGDEIFLVSSTPEVALNVAKAATSLTLESNTNPSVFGLPVLVTASLSEALPCTVTPAGMVQFSVDGVAYGPPVILNDQGQASMLLPYAVLPAGEHSITAVYTGNENFSPSDNLANPLRQTVEMGSLVISLAPTVENPVFGQPVSLSVSIAGDGAGLPVPAGTVQFGVDGADLGAPVALDSSGSAVSIPATALSVGPHTLNLTYSGGGSYPSTSLNVPEGLWVARASTGLSFLNAAPLPAKLGQPVAFAFDVQAVAPGAGQPAGKVTVSYAGDSCTAGVAEGSCELTPAALVAADSPLTLAYSGDENFNPAEVNPSGGPAVGKAEVSLAIGGVTPAQVVFGQAYTVSLQVSPLGSGTLIPVGEEITISDGVETCTAAVRADGSADCALTAGSAGRQTLTADFAGTDRFASAASPEYTELVVAKASTVVSLATSANPVIQGAPVRFTASVAVLAPGSGVPAGQVQFIIDGEPAGSPVDLAGGTAAGPEITDISAGEHAITAAYLGSDRYTSGASAPVSQVVVSGDLSQVVKPGEAVELVYAGLQNGRPVTTRIQIPAGAVDREVTLVYRQFDGSLLNPPAGLSFVANFTLDAYIGGKLQPQLTFLEPLTLVMGYNPENWDEGSFALYAWDSSQWKTGGIELTGRDPDAASLTFTLAGTGPDEFSLSGVHHYIARMPLIHN